MANRSSAASSLSPPRPTKRGGARAARPARRRDHAGSACRPARPPTVTRPASIRACAASRLGDQPAAHELGVEPATSGGHPLVAGAFLLAFAVLLAGAFFAADFFVAVFFAAVFFASWPSSLAVFVVDVAPVVVLESVDSCARARRDRPSSRSRASRADPITSARTVVEDALGVLTAAVDELLHLLLGLLALQLARPDQAGDDLLGPRPSRLGEGHAGFEVLPDRIELCHGATRYP